MFPLFFIYIPWVTASPIEELHMYEEMQQEYPAPTWAKCFTVNHGIPTYFRTSPQEQPLRAILYGGALALCWAALAIPALYYSPDDKQNGNWFSRMRVKRERKIEKANHGLESTGAPPAAGTPETHP